jgi:hypothetical protein
MKMRIAPSTEQSCVDWLASGITFYCITESTEEAQLRVESTTKACGFETSRASP